MSRINSGSKGSSIKYAVMLGIVSVALNMLGTVIVRWAGAPIFLDTLGTVIAAALGGYMPGILVGFATNMIKGFIDSTELYYSLLNMVVAVVTAYFANRGFFKSIWKALIVIPVLSLITGSLSAILTWFMYGSQISGTGEGIAESFYHNFGMSAFAAQYLKEVLIELADKSITIIIAMIVIRLVPARYSELFTCDSIAQAPMSKELKKQSDSIKCRSVTLRVKVLLVVLASTLIVALLTTSISYMLFKDSTIEEHKKLATGLTGMAVEFIDGDRVDEFIEKGKAAPGYIETEQMLERIKDSAADVQYVYVYKIMEDGCHVVFDLDTEEVEGSEPGDVIEFDESFMPYLPTLLAGGKIDPIISDDSYGWLLTVYAPVYDSNGKTACYAAVDISMNLISSYGFNFLAKLISMLMGFFVLIIAVCMWVVEHNITRPINSMAYCAGSFAYNSDEAMANSVDRIRSLKIRTGDEVENLYHAILKMSEDSMEYVEDIMNKTETISKMQNGLIMVLADMVESRDKCTGDHVRKTAAYAKLIMAEMKKHGYYADQLTDEFVENVGNAAPLHDIGKIHVSDVILNKPGRLTDEEFVEMRKHTIYGSEVIDQAMENVSDSIYLEEAKKISEYHHEKWNGTGYPHGLSGEDIPLSARIMAVADVFDALVSKRSYKKPFSFEKAMSIIREDAGSHFDPLVADAFLGAEDRVREIAESFEANGVDRKW